MFPTNTVKSSKTLRRSTESVVVLADHDNHDNAPSAACDLTFRPPGTWAGISSRSFVLGSAAGRQPGSAAGQARPYGRVFVEPRCGTLGSRPIFHLHTNRVGGSLSESLAGTAVDEIMQLAEWRARKVATSYIGATTSEVARGKPKQSDNAHLQRSRQAAVGG